MSEVSEYLRNRSAEKQPKKDLTEVQQYFTSKRNEPASQLRSSMVGASKTQPDQYAEVIDLATKTRLPNDVVERNVEMVKDKQRRESGLYDQLIDESPGAAAFLSDSANAKLAHDDVDGLKAYEAANRNITRKAPIEKPFADFAESPIGSVLQMTGDLARSIPAGGVRLAGGGMDALAQYTESINKVYPGLFDAMRVPGEDFSDVQRRAGVLSGAGQNITDIANVIGAPEERRGDLPAMVGEGVGQMALYGLSPTATMAAFFAVSFKSGEDKAKAAGVDDETALAVGNLYGLASFLTEKVGMERLYNRALPKIANPTFRKIFDLVLGSGIEGAEELVEKVSHQLIDIGLYDPTAKIDFVPGKEELSAVLASMLTRSVVGGAKLRAESKEREGIINERIGELRELRDTAIQSKLFTRHKGKFDEFAQKAAENGEDPNIYLDAEAAVSYLQEKGENVEQALESLGVTDQAQEALWRGGKLVVPINKFISTYGDTEHFDALLNDVAIYQGDETLNELKQTKDIVDEEITAAAENVETASEAYQFGIEVDTLIREQMGDRFTPDVVDKYAALHKSIASRAVSDGIATVDQMKKYYDLEINDDLQDVALEQAKEEGYSDIEVTRTVTIEETGDVVEITERGDVAFKRAKEQVMAYQEMIKCLGSQSG